MEVGRRFLLAEGGRVGGSTPAEVSERALRRVIPDFWGRLAGFAQLGVPRRGWDAVGPRHPILRVMAGRLLCVGPVYSDSNGEEAG